MLKLLRNLLKSPMFVIGISIFVLTLLIALFGPIFYSVDTHARDILAGPYAGSSSEHLLGTDHLGRDYVSLLIAGLRSSLYVGFVAGIIATTIGVLIGLMDPSKQTEVDDAMIALDGNRMLKNKLGANAILGVSMAVCVAAAKDAGLPLYQYIAKLHGTKKLTLPCPMCNVINGGAHSSAPIDFQEFMIAPVGAKTFSKGLQISGRTRFAGLLP